jgi:hypothetical protein
MSAVITEINYANSCVMKSRLLSSPTLLCSNYDVYGTQYPNVPATSSELIKGSYLTVT